MLTACTAAGVKHVVLTSSTAAIYGNRHGAGHVVTEEDWSDLEYCTEKEHWYWISKTKAERCVTHSSSTLWRCGESVLYPHMACCLLLAERRGRWQKAQSGSWLS